MADLVDGHDVDVFAFGLATDFRTELFPATRRLFELADEVARLQVEVLCWCGREGQLNARIVDGVVAREGEQVVIGDTGAGGGRGALPGAVPPPPPRRRPAAPDCRTRCSRDGGGGGRRAGRVNVVTHAAVSCRPRRPCPMSYAEDPVLRSWLGRLLGDDGLAAAEGPLKALAAEVMGPLRAAHADAEAHPPVLHRYDGWGARVDRVEVSAGLGTAAGRRGRTRAWSPCPTRPTPAAMGRRGTGCPARPAAPVRAGVGDVHLPGGDGRRRGGAAVTLRCGQRRPGRVAAPADLHRPGRGHHQRAVDDRVAGRLGRRAGRPRSALAARPTGRGGSRARSGSARRSTPRWRWRWPDRTARAMAARAWRRSSSPATRPTPRWPASPRRRRPGARGDAAPAQGQARYPGRAHRRGRSATTRTRCRSANPEAAGWPG